MSLAHVAHVGRLPRPGRAGARGARGRKKKVTPPPTSHLSAREQVSNSSHKDKAGQRLPRPTPVLNTTGVIGGVAHVGPAAPGVMHAFSGANLNAAGAKRCFNFWRRGICNNGTGCSYAHD